MLHKRDDAAVDGWDPEDHPRSVISGRDERRGGGGPASACGRATARRARAAARRAFARADRRRARRARRAAARRAPGRFQGRELALTNLDKVLFPRATAATPVTKRELVRYYAWIAPTLLPYLARASAQPAPVSRTASTRKGFWQKQAPQVRARLDPAVAQRRRRRRRERAVPRGRQPAGAGVAREPRRGRAASVDVADPRRRSARRTRSIDLDPGRGDDLGRAARRSPGCTAPRSSTSACAATRRPPAGAGSRSGSRSSRARRSTRRGRGSSSCRARSRGVVGDLVSGEVGEAGRGGRARLDYTQNAINKTLVAPYSVRAGAGRAGVDADHVGRARRSRPPLRSLGRPHAHRARVRGRRPDGADARGPSKHLVPLT